MLSNALKSSSPRIILHLGYEHEITFFFHFIIHYVIDNEEEAENIYREVDLPPELDTTFS